MNSVAFLVDGHQEMKFLQAICPGKRIRMLNCNGDSVSAEAIAKRVGTLCRLFSGKHYPIVIWVDLETRDASATEFSQELEQAIRNEGVTDDLILGVADRCIENWILADKKTVMDQVTKPEDYPSHPDGFNGKSKIKNLIVGYHPTTTGVNLLERCHASRMTASPSFKAFYDQLPKESCWWLQR